MEDGNLSGKYLVERADGSPPRATARFFVLNYADDPYARVAMRAYAKACRDTHPTLATDVAAVADYHDEQAALARRSSRPSTRNQASGGDPASSEDLLEALRRRAASDPEVAAQLRAIAAETI